MLEYQKILKFIENLHEEQRRSAGAPRILNRGVALYLGWFYYTPSEARNKWKGSWKRGAWIHPDDCTDGKPVFCQLHGTEIHRDIPDFVRSRDALKRIRPEGWQWACDFTAPDIGYDWMGWKEGAPAEVRATNMQTEELAELHAIIQAIEWERNNEKKQ